ncbi:MAG: dihydroxyacetone kinase subunit DhaK [Bacteroidaceae bacterium]|nr:dihydroxyacetone kinase subunit DhaK [Bacteroidaceae bacterium]MBP5646785.1 dihydroxyacetone kinase subunit DhaK [Bacteroidaceae bacterium]
MQKIINDPGNVVDEMLQGFVKAHPELIAVTGNERVLKYCNAPVENKVGIVTGGGSGHKPAFIGYIGRNMVDAVAVGELFSSPPAQMFYDAIREADAGKGVAILYGNYAGDNMNVEIAMEQAEEDGIKVARVVANDDVPSAPRTEPERRRGVAGEILMWKTGGAKAAMGGTLEEVVSVAKKAIGNTRSMGVGLSPCTIPEVGHPNFTIEPGMMEVGIGHHGEPGIEVAPLETAAQIAERMCNVILPDLPFCEGDETVVLVSGLGSTPLMELYILYNEVYRIMEERGIRVYRSFVGNYFTSLEMAGATLSVMKLDDELKACIDYEAASIGLTV